MKLKVKLIGKLIAPRAHYRYDKKDACCFEHSTDTIIIGSDFAEDGAGFRRHLHRIHGCQFTYHYSMRLWTLLHEIGHFEMDELCEEDDRIQRWLCTLYSKEKAQRDLEIASLYYNLEAEWEATEWAMRWIAAHPVKAKIFNILLG